MEDMTMQKERRRQYLEKRRKKRMRRMILRGSILLGVVIVSIGLVGGLIKWAVHRGDKKEVAATLQDSSKQTLQQNTSQVAKGDKVTSSSTEEGPYEAMTKESLGEGNLVLVNEENPLRQYDDGKLISIGEKAEGNYLVKNKLLKLQPEALTALTRLLTQFKQLYPENELIVISGYRSFEEQEALHYESILQKEQASDQMKDGNKEDNKEDKKEEKKTNEAKNVEDLAKYAFVAKPDRSEHHTGLAVDFGVYHTNGTSSQYDGKGDYEWINENCYKYGFILRYDNQKKDKTGINNEPWHFRYVGIVHATMMKELGLCLEEYETYLKTYRCYTNPLQPEDGAGKGYSIYYVPLEGDITNVPVPKTKEYEISGNNKDGFIVTVNLKGKAS